MKGFVAGIVLAAGKGTRMRSALPKVLHPVAGRPMLAWVIAAIREAGVKDVILVLGPERDIQAKVLEAAGDCVAVSQANRLGTGEAVAAAARGFAGAAVAPYAAGDLLQGGGVKAEWALICAGDTPAIRGEALADFIQGVQAGGTAFGVLGMRQADPTGYGRLIGGDGLIDRIVEEKDATPQERQVDICNSGVMLVRTELLFSLLGRLTANNKQNEYYLTDCVGLARERGERVALHVASEPLDFAGINDRAQLAAVERRMINRHLDRLMKAGASIHLPETVYAEPEVTAGQDSDIGAGCHLSGATRIGAGCRIGPGARLARCVIGDGASIGGGSQLEDSVIAAGESLPPLTVRLG